MSLLDAGLFRAFDIRGSASAFTDAGVRALGRAIAAELRAREGSRCVVGRDGRPESLRLHRALIAGLVRQGDEGQGIEGHGIEVIDLGRVPTPLVHFALSLLNADGAVQTTGSHMPPGQNGFKIALGASTIAGAEIQRLRERMDGMGPEPAEVVGSVRSASVDEAHLEHCLARLRTPRRRLRVVVDGGEGVGGPHAVRLLRRLGCDVVPLLCEPDGRFPSRGPDPSPHSLSLLHDRVKSTNADFGIALDGDADRLVAMDETGQVVDGDRLLLLFAGAVLAENPGAAIVGEVKCSQVLFDEVGRLGGRSVLAPVGHAFVREAMRREGALLGGELSGHFYFADRHLGFDDAFYAAGRLVELVASTSRSLSESLASLPRMETSPEMSLPFPRRLATRLVAAVASRFRALHEVLEIDGARISFENGWALVRASQTSDAVGMRFEAKSPEALDDVRRRVEAVVREEATAIVDVGD